MFYFEQHEKLPVIQYNMLEHNPPI